MLPHTHIALTWLAFDLLEDYWPALREADRRLVAVATSAPDLIDKPLATAFFYRRYKSAMLFAHTLLAQLAVIGAAVSGGIRWPYAVAFLLHGVQDRLWMFHDTFWWPLRGWRFHVWRKQGSEQADIGRAYWHAFTRRPELWVWEVLGLLALIWLVWRHRLYQPQGLLTLARSGRFPD
jgi:hypothetical protein